MVQAENDASLQSYSDTEKTEEGGLRNGQGGEQNSFSGIVKGS